MARTRVLVTGATGRIGGAVAAQLIEKGVATRALVHREDDRSARLRELGVEVAVADMFDYRQVEAAMAGVGRVFFNPPVHPHALDSGVAFAVAARRSGVEAVVALGQWLASPEHPSLLTRQQWLTDKVFDLLPDTAHIAVDPGFFADNYLQLVPTAALLGVFPMPAGVGRNAPPSNEDIARVAVGGLLEPHRHDGMAYRPTGPKLLSAKEIADAIGEAVGRKVRHIEVPPSMFMRAVRMDAKRLKADMFLETGLRHYLSEHALGTWEVGGPTTHVRDVAGVEPEDFLTIARRYAADPAAQRTVGNIARALGNSFLMAFVPMHRLDKFDRMQQHPQPAQPRLSGESAFWRAEHQGDKLIQYSTGNSRRNIEQALTTAGKNLDDLQPTDLMLVEDFHTMGRIATTQLADLTDIGPDTKVLDAGSGIGGTARYLAGRFECRVTAVDLTEDYCDTARWLNRLVGLDDRITVHHGDVTALPFADASYQAVFSQHVQMNIPDKHSLYREAHRVLTDGGLLAIWDITAGDLPDPDYPLPWADAPNLSHLVDSTQLRDIIEASGFEIEQWNDLTDQSATTMQAILALPPNPLGLHAFNPNFPEKLKNLTTALADGRLHAVQGIARARRH
ncbi:methyltransferase domain-containing protein [Nocardia sp. SYP-A9097]|uniref:NmrA family NAD(P)-binding protein n=1 Tax=Nocardia sp. SYP-A9097 TaxID=2663237 RepID=UPI0018913426|nr:methyltransferase domain-containing protein [Nocardia sp. SYP-A9097]